MADPFVERMMERARKRREALGRVSSSSDGKENKEIAGLPTSERSSIKATTNRFTDESKDAEPKESFKNARPFSPKKMELATNKRPTNLDDFGSSRSVPPQVSDTSSPSSRPRLGVLAARCQQMREWDDDYRHISSSHDVQVLGEQNHSTLKETNCKPCINNEMHEPDPLPNSDDIDVNVSSVCSPKKQLTKNFPRNTKICIW